MDKQNKTYDIIHLVATFDHYSTEEYYDDYWEENRYKPMIDFIDVTDVDTGEVYGATTLNLTKTFRKFGVFKPGTKVSFTARHYLDKGGIAYPTNVIPLDDRDPFPSKLPQIIKFIRQLNHENQGEPQNNYEN